MYKSVTTGGINNEIGLQTQIVYGDTVMRCMTCGCEYYPPATHCPHCAIYQTLVVNNVGWICPKCDSPVTPYKDVCPICSPLISIDIDWGGSTAD